MKEKILILILLIFILGATIAEITVKSSQNRYEVITGSNRMTVLLDKKTGVTWRNCVCDEKSNVPGCWERMITINPQNYTKPIGEVSINKKLLKDLKKQQKLQERQTSEQ